MIDVKYGLLPKENFCRYFEFLINKIISLIYHKNTVKSINNPIFEKVFVDFILSAKKQSMLLNDIKIRIFSNHTHCVTKELKKRAANMNTARFLVELVSYI